MEEIQWQKGAGRSLRHKGRRTVRGRFMDEAVRSQSITPAVLPLHYGNARPTHRSACIYHMYCHTDRKVKRASLWVTPSDSNVSTTIELIPVDFFFLLFFLHVAYSILITLVIYLPFHVALTWGCCLWFWMQFEKGLMSVIGWITMKFGKHIISPWG